MELNIRFNQYSIKPFKKAWVRFNNLWIHLVFKESSWVSMPKMPYPPFQKESWIRCLGGSIFCGFQKKLYMLFSVSFLIYSRIVYIWPMHHSFDERVQFTIIFFPLKDSRTLFEFDFLDPCIMEGPIKPWFFFCLFVCPLAVQHFY